MYKKYISIITLATFVGCSPVHKVQFQSNPSGAMIYCNGEKIGFTPQVVSYHLTSQQEDEEILRIESCSAQWISGAHTKVDTIKVKLPQVHFSTSSYLFTRPEFPDYNEDLDFSRRAKMLQEIKRQTQVARARRENYEHERNTAYHDNYNDCRGYNDHGYQSNDNARMHVSH